MTGPAPAPAPPAAAEILFRSAAIVPRAAESDAPPRSIDVVASTDAIDSHGTTLAQDWDLARYAENPVVLYAHNSWELPIGRAENVRIENGQLKARLVFAAAGTTDLADQAWSLVEQGILRGISVGFWPHTVTFERRDDIEVLVLSDNELLEISVCPVPSNPETLAGVRSRALASRADPPAAIDPPAAPAAPPTPPSPPTPAAPALPENRMDTPTPKPSPAAIRSALGSITDEEHKAHKGYVSQAPDDVGGMTDEHRTACRSAIETRMDKCRDDAMAEGRAFDAQLRSLLEQLGAEDLDTALAAVAALRSAASSVEASTKRVADLERQLDGVRRREILADAKRGGKITPAMEASKDWQREIAAMTTAQIETHFRVMPRLIPRGAVTEPSKPGAPQPTVDVGDRSWSQLSIPEKAALRTENRDLYEALKRAHDAQSTRA